MPWVIGCRSGSQPEKCAKALFEDLTAFKLYATLNLNNDTPKMAVFLKPEIFFNDTILIALQKKQTFAFNILRNSRPSILMGQATQRWQEGPIFQALETLERQFREEHRGERVLWGVQVVNQTWIPVTSEMFGLFRLIGWWTYYLQVS